MIRLSPEAEPQIYACTRRFGTILENVAIDPLTRRLDLNDDSVTENTRAAYPLRSSTTRVPEKMGGHPTNVIFLTCDASGVMPPIARLTPEQAMYHFISGYTSKIAGTEVGLGIEPEITFSTCFGAPFMVHRPLVYAELLRAKMLRAQGDVLARQHRLDRRAVRRRQAHQHPPHARAAQCGPGREARRREVPQGRGVRLRGAAGVRGRAGRTSSSRRARGRAATEYDAKYDALAARFIENFKLFAENCPPEVVAAGPKRVR